ncbi:MAG TPA: sigma-70 family RNA polymerase sigma factor [Phycisphaerae bacterium]|nr:sigma-70 family RNA polymerase sigma factor [Phycisphaerae bacterium]HOB73281.1 sigma-70 family RNA polymerase sigma factor [Phycisphaerae bacterium]HOJ55737.1 sigma-70 family RNA polymerase sigma factor [Phycisphaerae bacterium]HOL26100.1 sigma-70 family RNA polymerase sigma factor [Phycisphaerae bacterium]HPP22016.1 sigma-70 family RNA polymerase sigma factor [Phycisphaerae bacterium]
MDTTQTNLLWAVRDSQDGEAWLNFYRIYSAMVTRFARRLGLSDADAEDVTQEVLLLAQRSLQTGTYDPAKGGFRQWLYGIARRRSLAALRARCRRTRAQWVPGPDGSDLVERLEDVRGEEAHRQVWEQEWRYALLDEALRHVERDVGEKAFQAFNLLALKNWPVEQIAAHLGIAPASVYVYKHRVLTAVKQRIARFEKDE